MENNGLEPLTPCVQSRCSKPTELIPPSRGLARCPQRISCYSTILLRLQKLAGGKAPPPSSTPPPLFPIGAPLSCRLVPFHPRPAAARCDRSPAARSRKEVFQPHLPVRLPCYDLAPVIRIALGRAFRSRTSGTPDSHGLTGGVYKARERIHRAMADARLLANPASWSRVADSNPNWDGVWGSAIARTTASRCAPPL